QGWRMSRSQRLPALPPARCTTAGGRARKMAEKLTRAVDRKWDERLENWAMWYAGDKVHHAETDAYERLEKRDTSDPGTSAAVWETADPPALKGEALDTHALVISLPPKPDRPTMFEAVRARYCWQGTLESIAADLGVERTTLWRRV